MYLVKTSRLIDRSSKAKKEMRTLMKDIHEQFSQTKDKILQAEKARDFIIARTQKLEDELINFKKEKETLKEAIEQLGKDKKEFAAQKKFKNAGQC